MKDNKERQVVSYQEFHNWVKSNPGAVGHLGTNPNALIATFNMYDVDGSHKLDRHEFEKMMKGTNVLCDELGEDVERELTKFVDNVFKRADVDGSGGIELDEYKEWARENPDRLRALERVAGGLQKDVPAAAKKMDAYSKLLDNAGGGHEAKEAKEATGVQGKTAGANEGAAAAAAAASGGGAGGERHGTGGAAGGRKHSTQPRKHHHHHKDTSHDLDTVVRNHDHHNTDGHHHNKDVYHHDHHKQ